MIYEVKNLFFSYPGGKRLVLDDISLTLSEGETLSVLGPNGAGKSTLFGCMTGLLKPMKGRIFLLGRELRTMSERERAAAVSFVPQQSIPTFGYSVFDYILMGTAARSGIFSRPSKEDREAVERVLEELEITALRDKPYTQISGGERQLASVARAIVGKPAAVLFDEPTAHLDFGNQLRILRVIRRLNEKGFAVAITTHNPDHAILLGGKTAVLTDSGKLMLGNTEDIVREDLLCRVYHTDLRLKYDGEIGRTVCLYPNL